MNKSASEVDHVYKCQEFTSTLYKDEIIYRKDPKKNALTSHSTGPTS